jgi:hypothetical protein
MKYLFGFIIVLFLLSCSDQEHHKKVFPEQLTGQWRNVYLRIELNSYKNSDSNHVLEVTEKNWERQMGIRPVRTYYWSDGTYNSEHLNLDDSVFYNPAGHWKLVGDSLYMNDTFPSRDARYAYRVVLNGDIAEFTGMEDCDNDGKKDDLYYGTQRKFTLYQ